MRYRRVIYLLVVIFLLALVGVTLYNVPAVHERVSWRVNTIRTQVQRFLNPPEKEVFVPAGVTSTKLPLEPTEELQLTPSLTPIDTLISTLPAATAAPTAIIPPTQTPTTIPSSTTLTGAVHEYQQMNNCGPATLSTALSFWGWDGDQRDTRAYLRPNFQLVDDKNVNPSEMVSFVEENTHLEALTRVGGDLEMLKRLISAGFPVIIEKGQQPHPGDWMGHYVLFTGHDDQGGKFISQDSYIMPDLPVPYDQVSEQWWRDFNNTYLVIYPSERFSEVLSILGPHSDVIYNHQIAADLALTETSQLEGRDLFFAWYNLGTNLVALGDYSAAALAYDQAFGIYPRIPEDDRLWRMLWYQSGPYEAYYHTGRYQDIITLGNQTLDQAGGPILEETFYWLGKARKAENDLEKAIYDYRKAYEINPLSTPAEEELQRLGIDV